MDEKSKIWDKVNNWSEELEILRSIINKTELVETVKWGGPIFTVHGKNVIGIGGFKNYFAIWFMNGALLKDDSKVLVNAQEGVTKALRQWRFNSKDDVNEKLVLNYILEAIANEKLGKSIKPEKKQPITSTLLQAVFDTDTELANAFQKFSPYKQYEFLEYIESAKREETKSQRIQKTIPMIKVGVGLNDKYR